VINSSIPVIRKGAPKAADALAPIAADAAPHEMRDPFDIGEALDVLAASGEPVSVYPARARHEVLMARIHSVDPEHPTFVIDFAGERPAPGPATLVASLGGNAKLQFELSQDWRGQAGQPNLVAADFPPACLVLNRRAAQRLETPVGVNYVATFKILGKAYELPLYDFSLGGVGLRATPEQAFGLRLGKKLDDVRLELGPALVVVADLEIRLLRPFKTFLLGEQVQIGCSFASISMQMQQNLESLVTTTSGRRRGG
jgi:c-di-GMP-binding flagellar brake protein YcgR